MLVLVRGWLHSNCVIVGGSTPTLIDTGYFTGADTLIRQIETLGGFAIEDLKEIYLTHVHSDHSGGCAELQTRTNATTWAHAQCRELVEEWSPRSLWLENTGQVLPRFGIDKTLVPEQSLVINGVEWTVIETLGHAVGGVSFYCRAHRLLISGDALWESGFGALHLTLEGEQIIDLAETALDNLAALDVAVVIPGHGKPFEDFEGALGRARAKLKSYREHPAETLRRDARAMLAFWLLANDGAPLSQFEEVVAAMLLSGRRFAGDERVPEGAVSELMSTLEKSNILLRDGDRVRPGSRLS